MYATSQKNIFEVLGHSVPNTVIFRLLFLIRIGYSSSSHGSGGCRRSVDAEDQILSQDSPYGIRGWQTVTGTHSSPTNSVFPHQYYSKSAACSFFYHPRYISLAFEYIPTWNTLHFSENSRLFTGYPRFETKSQICWADR